MCLDQIWLIKTFKLQDKVLGISEQNFSQTAIVRGEVQDFDDQHFPYTFGPTFMPPIHFWRHTQKNSNVFLARSDHTANVYRDLQGLYREIRLQGSRIYRDIIGVILAVTITLGYLINVQQSLLFFEKSQQIQIFQILISLCFTLYSQSFV